MGFQFFFQRNFEEFANGCGWGDTLGPSSTPPSPSFASAPQRLYVGRGTSETLICFGSEKQSARSPGFCVEKCGSRPLIFHGCMSWQRPDSVYLHWEHFNTIHVGNCGLVRDLVICEIDLTMKTRPHIGLKQVAELYLIFIDAMPRGFVCQLHYHGGGSLLCQTSTGDSWQLPFAHAPPHVRVGHTVTFSLAGDGTDLAVDLEVIKEKAAISSATAEVGLQSILEKAAKPASSFAKQPTRKLQRSIARFHNADLEERLQMIEAAESLLSDLLNAVELDGDAICKLLCRCAGWLHAPGSFEAKHVAAEVAASEVATVSQPSGPSDLQGRVRRLLISALSSLDLRDITTYQAVETAVLYIFELMQDKDIFFSGNGKSLAVRQWRQLRQLLVTDDAQHGPTKRKASDDAPEVLKERVARRIVAKDRSAVVDGLYRPNERVRSLPSVYEVLDQVVLLKCSNCVERISTSWFWKHPRHGRIRALVPSSGHSTCRKSLGKRCPWISLDGIHTCLDKFNLLDFCHHCQRSFCKECGGSEICPHGRQRSFCKKCGVAVFALTTAIGTTVQFARVKPRDEMWHVQIQVALCILLRCINWRFTLVMFGPSHDIANPDEYWLNLLRREVTMGVFWSPRNLTSPYCQDQNYLFFGVFLFTWPFAWMAICTIPWPASQPPRHRTLYALGKKRKVQRVVAMAVVFFWYGEPDQVGELTWTQHRFLNQQWQKDVRFQYSVFFG